MVDLAVGGDDPVNGLEEPHCFWSAGVGAFLLEDDREEEGELLLVVFLGVDALDDTGELIHHSNN